jgi:hypothetical protein
MTEIKKEIVLAKSRKLSATWSSEAPLSKKQKLGLKLKTIRKIWKEPVPRGLSLWSRIKRRIKIVTGKFTMEDVLSEMLAEEITAEINREILETIRGKIQK